MKVLIILLIVVVTCIIVYKVIKLKIKHRRDTLTSYTGGLGSGKTLLGSADALKLYKKQVRKWKRRKKLNTIVNIFRINKKVFDEERPLLYSNIPLQIKKGVYCVVLKKEHLLLQEHVNLHSVLFIDEIGAFANQFDYKDENVIKVFDEFIRFFRHYVQGYIICNDQCSENINLVIRRRLNIIHNLSNCFVFWRLCFYYERMINISEEIKTIDMRNVNDDSSNDTQDNMKLRFKFLWNKHLYDTHCYHGRYKTVPYGDIEDFTSLKTNKVLTCPKDKDKRYNAKTTND